MKLAVSSQVCLVINVCGRPTALCSSATTSGQESFLGVSLCKVRRKIVVLPCVVKNITGFKKRTDISHRSVFVLPCKSYILVDVKVPLINLHTRIREKEIMM